MHRCVSGRLRIHRSASFWPLVVLTLVVVAANFVYLAGITDPNPLAPYSGLGSYFGHRILPGLDYTDPNVGFTSQALGHLAASDWLHGYIPWWNPYEGLGTPLAGEMQGAALLPLVLVDALPWGQILFRLVLELAAAYATYFLLRRLVPSRAAATGGAVVFALNGTFAWMFHAAANPAAFLPVLVLGVEHAREPSRRWSGVALIAAGLALSVYAGFPETAYIDGLLAAVWFAVRATELRGRSLGRFAGRVAAGGVCGLMLAAPGAVAFVDYLHVGYVGQHAGAFGGSHLDRSVFLPVSVLPYILGPIGGWTRYSRGSTFNAFWGSVGGYLGLTAVVLAAIGVAGALGGIGGWIRGVANRDGPRRWPDVPHRRLRIVLGLWVALEVSRSVGLPVATKVLNAIPGETSTAFGRYFIPSATLALAALAALGVGDVRAARRPVRVGVVAALAGVAVAAAAHRGLQDLHLVTGAPHSGDWAWGSIAFGAALIVAVAVCAILPRPRWRGVALAGIMMVEPLALFVVPELANSSRTAVDTAPVRYLQSHLGTGRFFTLGPLAPDYGSYWRVAELDTNDLPLPKAFVTYMTTRLDTNVIPVLFTGHQERSASLPGPPAQFLIHLHWYQEAGVAYLLSLHGRALPPLPPGVSLPVVFDDGRVTIRAVPGAAPLFSGLGPAPACTVSTAGQTAATVDCTSAGPLVYREQYMPGWTATVDGRAVPVSAYEGVFQEVLLPAGRHRVSWSFLPPHERLAEAAFVLGVLLLVGAEVDGRRRRPHPPRSGADSPPADPPQGEPAGGSE